MGSQTRLVSHTPAFSTNPVLCNYKGHPTTLDSKCHLQRYIGWSRDANFLEESNLDYLPLFACWPETSDLVYAKSHTLRPYREDMKPMPKHAGFYSKSTWSPP